MINSSHLNQFPNDLFFFYYSNPTPNTDDELITTIWKSIDRSAKHYLEINDNLVPGVDPDKDKWKLWKSVLRDL